MRSFLFLKSFSFSVIAMVCLSPNHEWSQYLNYIGIGVKCSLCLSLSFSSPKGSRIWWSLRKVRSLFILSVHFPVCLDCCCCMHALLCTASGTLIGSFLITLMHVYCPHAELRNVSLWHCVNCQVRRAVFSGMMSYCVLSFVSVMLLQRQLTHNVR